MDPDQLASEEACDLIWIYSVFNRIYIQFHTVFKRVYTCKCILFMCDLLSLGQVKLLWTSTKYGDFTCPWASISFYYFYIPATKEGDNIEAKLMRLMLIMKMTNSILANFEEVIHLSKGFL